MEQFAAALGLDHTAVTRRLDILTLSETERARLRLSAPAAEANADRFITELYALLTQSPGTAGWFSRPGTVDRLRAQQRHYLTELFAAPLDRSYVLRRLQIGVVHHRVRLTPRWYVATCAHFVCDHIDVILGSAPTPAEGIDRLITLVKTILFDASLVLDAYGLSLENSMRTEGPALGPPETPAAGTAAAPPAKAPVAPTAERPFTGLRLTEDDCAERCKFLRIDDATGHELRQLTPTVRAALPGMLAEFYASFRQWPETEVILTDEVVERLLQQVSAYWLELAQAKFDRPYAASRTRIGIVHEKIGVTPQLYLIGLSRQLDPLVRAIAAGRARPAHALASLFRAVFFDVSFVMDAYIEACAASVLRNEGYASKLLSSLNVGVAVLDDSRRVRSANPALLQLLGIEAGVVRYLPAADLLQDNRVGALLDQLAADPTRREQIRVRYGGRLLRVTAVKLDHSPGEPGSGPVALLVDDITDLVALAPDVDQAERRLGETVAAVDAVLWEAEAQTWTMTLVSAPVLGLTGLRDVHFLGRPQAWLDIIPQPDRTRFTDRCARLAGAENCTVVHRLMHSSGTVRWVRTSVRRTGSVPAESAFRGVSIDISSTYLDERRRVEAVGRLAGSIAHEFNGLLTVISGNLWLLREAHGSTSREIAQADAAVARGAGLTRQLQAFAQGVPLFIHATAINDELAAIEGELRQNAGANVDLELAPGADLWPCELDPTQFRGAVFNLIENARDAMPQGGRIRLSTRNLTAREILPTEGLVEFVDHVELSVSDTGQGMDAEARLRAAEPFFSTKARPGLGLSVVHGFVHQCRGHLVIESAVNRGTTVRLRFPRYSPPQLAPVTTARRILIVDDDLALAEILLHVLDKLGYEAAIVHSPEEARAAIAGGRPEAVLCDVMFKGEPVGQNLGRELAHTHPGLPVIYMSGYTQASLNLDADMKFLQKPFDMATLGKLLQELLAR